MREHGLSEFEIEQEGLRLQLRKEPVVTVAAAPRPSAGTAPMVAAASPAAADTGGAAPGAQAQPAPGPRRPMKSSWPS